jgi:hypothetical protein
MGEDVLPIGDVPQHHASGVVLGDPIAWLACLYHEVMSSIVSGHSFGGGTGTSSVPPICTRRERRVGVTPADYQPASTTDRQ